MLKHFITNLVKAWCSIFGFRNGSFQFIEQSINSWVTFPGRKCGSAKISLQGRKVSYEGLGIVGGETYSLELVAQNVCFVLVVVCPYAVLLKLWNTSEGGRTREFFYCAPNSDNIRDTFYK